MTLEQIRKAKEQDRKAHFEVMDSVCNTLQSLIHDTRLTESEQKDVSIAWGYLYYMNVVDKKMSKLNEGQKILPH